MIVIRPVSAATAKDLKDINLLIPQLSDSARLLTLRAYRSLLRDKSTYLLAARENGRIVGIGGMIFMHSPLFTAGYVTDVVVDETMRGKGIGTRLMKELIAVARKRKMDMVDLTSRPSRVAANKLYRSLGFERRDTNVYRMKLR